MTFLQKINYEYFNNDSAPNNINRALENEGYLEAAVDILNNNGLEAWVNCAGHIAINPEGLNV